MNILIDISFQDYVEHMINADEENPEPTCMFPYWDAECYVDRRDPEHGCLNCQAAKESYENLDPELVKKYMTTSYQYKIINPKKAVHDIPEIYMKSPICIDFDLYYNTAIFNIPIPYEKLEHYGLEFEKELKGEQNERL